jgi:hypothetical protein
MRFRPGDTVKREHDALLIFESENVIIDHSSLSWAVDENLDVTNSRNVTVQWSIISEGLNKSHHSKGKHSSGSLQANSNVSYHHNLFASNYSRNPLIQQQADVVNNVFYNYGHWGALIGRQGGRDPSGKTQVNLQNNYYIAGPSTDLVGTPLEGRMVRLFEQAKLWMSGNLLDTNKDGVLNGVLADERNVEFHDTGGTPNGVLKPRRFDFPEVETTDAKTAYHQVLADAGASLARDGVDNRLVNQVTQQTGKIINSQKKVGAWPELVSGQLQRDQDGDGLPDAWELQHGMDPRDPSDARADSNADGHTNLEEYHNEIAR